MRIGVAKEIKPDEYRIALTPAGALELINHGHDVAIEQGAGAGSAFPDEAFSRVGAEIVSVDDVWQRSDMVLKVKEPIEPEYSRLREGLILFTYLHIAADEPLTRALLDSGVTGVAYETVEVGRALPLLAPMSEVAGRLASQAGAYFLEKPLGGRGLLLGGVPGVAPGRVVVVGGGVVGYNAAIIALGLGAQVTILERSIDRMRHLEEILSGRVTLLMSSSLQLAASVADADLVVGAVLIPGALAPKLVTRDMIASMKKGAGDGGLGRRGFGLLRLRLRAEAHDEPCDACRERDHRDDEHREADESEHRLHESRIDTNMARACVIVLDAVGAGELPDASEFGDEGSDTLGNVARAVGGLDLPTLEAFGLGNVKPLEGCPPQPGAPAVAGRLVERSKGKDTTTGHWELMGIVTPQALPTYPHGFPFEVIDPFMHRTGRGVLGNQAASGTELDEELGEEHQRTGKWIVYTSADSVFQIAAHEDTIPLEELYDACRTAREILTGKHAVGRVIARPFTGEPGNYERTPNRHDFSLEPKRPNYLSLVRDAGLPVHGVGKIYDIFAGVDIDESHPTKSNVEGITQTARLLRELDDGLVFTNLVETDMLWGHRNDPVNFHRCLQDFDRRLPDLLDALRPGDLLILTSDHGCDPTTPSTDHSREYALLVAYVEGKNADGALHEAEFADVGATVNRWLGGKAPGRGIPGQAILEP